MADKNLRIDTSPASTTLSPIGGGSFIARVNGTVIPQWFARITLGVLGFLLAGLSVYTLSSSMASEKRLDVHDAKFAEEEKVLDRIERNLEKITNVLVGGGGRLLMDKERR